MKRYTTSFVITIALILLGIVVGYMGSMQRNKGANKPDVTTIIDTIPVIQYFPVAKDSVVIRYETVQLSKAKIITVPATGNEEAALPNSNNDSQCDSVEVTIPIEQKVYREKDYTAYVSGFRVSLDSIYINRITERTTIRAPTKQPKISIGLQAGYGYTPEGFQPYIGIGITANLWSY